MKWKQLSGEQQKAILRHTKAEEIEKLFDADETKLEAALEAVQRIDKETSDSERAKAYDSFLLADYNNIANAHFNTNSNITSFFQFYLIIIGLPITILGAILQLLGGRKDANGSPLPFTFSDVSQSEYAWFLFAFALAISFIGLCMLAYIVNLRLDSLQYARVINGIRRYFLDRGKIDVDTEQGTRALPRSIHKPKYQQWHYFGFVVAAFVTLDLMYFGFAGLLLGYRHAWNTYAVFWIAFSCAILVWIAFHILAYVGLSRYRDLYYLRSYIIGIDIDGVLNHHRETFCKIVKEETGKDIDPMSISRIPVHECSTLKTTAGAPITITSDEEYLVFNRVDYWQNAPASSDAEQTLREFKETLHHKVRIFSYRPWPNPIRYDRACEQNGYWSTDRKKQKLAAFDDSWSNLAWFSTYRPFDVANNVFKRWYNRRLEKRRLVAVTRMTKSWLKANRLPYDSLMIERGNVHVADPRTKVWNRFNVSRWQEIRIFIEDDPTKARKLANICEFVYLIAHPYNEQSQLSQNIIRVDSLKAAMQHIRDHL